MSQSVDFQKLQVVVKDYQRSQDSVVVFFECSYRDESKDFFESIPLEENKKTVFYVQKAFKKLKKPIKKWVRDAVKTSPIIGQVMSIPADFGVDDEDTDP